MDDNLILDLYYNRSESAITETASKYGGYCFAIAANILSDSQDSEECVNDTYMKAWEAIPPQRPAVFGAFLGKITRNLSLNRYKARNAQKRSGDFSLVYEELQECLPAAENVEHDFDSKRTGVLISKFLRSVQKDNRTIFVRRYWYGDSVGAIAKRFGMSESKVKSSLFRTRNKLRAELEKEGIEV